MPSLVAVACFLPGRAEDLSAPPHKICDCRITNIFHLKYSLFWTLASAAWSNQTTGPTLAMPLHTPLQLGLHEYEVKNTLKRWQKTNPDSSQDQQSNWKIQKADKTCWTDGKTPTLPLQCYNKPCWRCGRRQGLVSRCELPETPTMRCSLPQEEEEAAWAAWADDLPSSPESTSKIYTLTKGIHRPATVITGSHNEHNAHTTVHLTAQWLIPPSKAYAWWYATHSLWMQNITMTKHCWAANNRYQSDTVKFLNNSPDGGIGYNSHPRATHLTQRSWERARSKEDCKWPTFLWNIETLKLVTECNIPGDHNTVRFP